MFAEPTNHRPEDKPRHGNLVAQVGGYGEEYLPSHLIKNRIPMKEERNIITMDERGAGASGGGGSQPGERGARIYLQAQAAAGAVRRGDRKGLDFSGRCVIR